MKSINANKLHRKSGGMGHPSVGGGEKALSFGVFGFDGDLHVRGYFAM
jgi:hypothetical protein